MTTQPPHVTPLTAKEIARADIDYAAILETEGLRSSARVFNSCVGSMRALGYGDPWIATAMGCDVEALRPLRHDRKVPLDLMRDALTVAIRVGDRWATPENSGQPQDVIDAVKAEARLRHRYPPAAYDDLYSYISGAAVISAEPESTLGDKRLTAKIEALAYFVRQGGSSCAIGAQFALSNRTIQRALATLGVRVLVREGRVSAATGQYRLLLAITRAHAALMHGMPAERVWADLVMAATDYHAAHSAISTARRPERTAPMIARSPRATRTAKTTKEKAA